MNGMPRIKKGSHILVTGGTGFLGAHVVSLLVKKGYRVSVVGRGKGEARARRTGVRFFRADLLRRASVENVLRKIGATDAVVHCAADLRIDYALLHPQEVLGNNVTMVANLLEGLRLRRFHPLVIFTSTDRVYGATKKRTVDEKEPPCPLEPYTASKIMGEVLLETYQALSGIPYIVFRIDSIYGPHQPSRMFVGALIEKMMKGTFVPVGDLGVRKNFVYVEDVVDAMLKALEASATARNTVYNIGGAQASFQEVADTLRKLVEERLQKKIEFRFDPALVRKGGTEVNAFRLSTAKARKNLGWKSRVSLQEGLARTFEYFLIHHQA